MVFIWVADWHAENRSALVACFFCAYKPSTLQKKSSNLRQSCATNVHSENISKFGITVNPLPPNDAYEQGEVRGAKGCKQHGCVWVCPWKALGWSRVCHSLDLSINGPRKQSSHLVLRLIFLLEWVTLLKHSDWILINEWVWLESWMYLGWLSAVLCPVWGMET